VLFNFILIFAGIMAHIKQNVPLKLYNTFGIEALAASFASVKNVEDLEELKAMNCFENNAFLVLGGGSNILLSKNLIESVIHIDIQGITVCQEDENHAWVKVGSGVIWHDLVLWAIEKDLSGIENLSLIPGTCGAAPMQNIGAYGADIEQVSKVLKHFILKVGNYILFTKRIVPLATEKVFLSRS
jgi:UDP-N-acetylmuramate dehydrogenase